MVSIFLLFSDRSFLPVITLSTEYTLTVLDPCCGGWRWRDRAGRHTLFGFVIKRSRMHNLVYG